MKIIAQDVGKRFRFEWVFKHFDFTFESGRVYAITGPNGSGKSTLLKCLAGATPPSKGKVVFEEDKVIHEDDVYTKVSLAAPYLELIEELTLDETLDFHREQTGFPLLSNDEVITKLGLGRSRKKQLTFFSSGMKQRVKLALALYTQRDVLLLDEPTSNLDEDGCRWYLSEIKEALHSNPDRIVIIGSNDINEYQSFEPQLINLGNYKPNQSK